MIFAIIALTIAAILIVLFIRWFAAMKINGKCPLCALQKIFISKKVTQNLEDFEDYGSGAALTPMMGWSSWNIFRQNIDEDTIYETAKAMKDSGLADAGYKYINLDDCWQSSLRDDMGRLQGDLTNFPSGIPALIKKINELDLKVGLYTSNGTLTCEDLPASLGTEELDAKTFASWGCEFFKYDFCHANLVTGHAPLIEAVEFSRRGEKAFKRLTADDAQFTGMAKKITCKDIPTGNFIGYLSFGSGTASMTVDAPENGDYILTILHHKVLMTKEQYVQIIINGVLYEHIFPPTKGFSPTGRQQIQVKLNAGSNSILIQNPVKSKADASFIQYTRMGKALKKATKEWAEFTGEPEKPILYSICEWGTTSPWNWGAKAGNMWRTTHDIFPNWTNIRLIYEKNVKLYAHSKPGSWNDPDMLQVGNGKLTDDENTSHFALWCMMAAPLVLGNDIRKFIGEDGKINANSTYKTVTNKSLINIDQDPLGKAAKRIKSGAVDILVKPLSKGDIALCFFNKSRTKRSVKFSLNSLVNEDYTAWEFESENYEVHDLLTDERTKSSEISTFVAPHAVKVYRLRQEL